MWINMVKEKLGKQQKVCEALKKGDDSLVCYKEFKNEEDTDDANYVNRLRLAYYLWYFHMDEEETISWLFKEELKIRENHSSEMPSLAIQILAHLLQKYNADGKYAELYKRAKNANFDCDHMHPLDMADDLEELDILDCICLCWRLNYKDVMGHLVDEWKQETVEWDRESRQNLISFNEILGRILENEALYKTQLDEAIAAESDAMLTVMSGYLDLILYYKQLGDYENAIRLCWTVIEEVDYGNGRIMPLGKSFLEICFEIIAAEPSQTEDLWNWARDKFKKVPSPIYENLYKKGIMASKAQNDPYWKELEQAYKKELSDN